MTDNNAPTDADSTGTAAAAVAETIPANDEIVVDPAGQARVEPRAEVDDDDDEDAPVGSLDAEAEVAADYLEELLDIADLDGDIDQFVENGRAQVSIVTDSQVLVGKDGEVLEALQELVRLAVMAETDRRTRLMLDVAGYRDKRRKTLRELAADAVQEVKESGEPARLAPMNPFERKIVHDAVAEAGLRSESEGKEPQRRVVVLPAE